ncbi:hypothetical protein [Prosthecobacter sp.]|uniref:hypothetical protein n=1 Tax=Prosthecobacter sp. TaxID=1965333 RepID=UPI002487BBDF|nr:hypothetical protein [Prosthecobacter sp.]MDI1313797.1 hypothetical protein [Prosthecobacter sp.]
MGALLGCSLLSSCTFRIRPEKAYFDGSITTPKHENAWRVARRFDSELSRDQNTNRFFVAEFAQDGQPKVSQQLITAVEQIKEFNPKTVLLYIHGWHNDSSPDCGEAKKKDMNDLDGLVHRMVEAKMGRVLAIYVAWRGESLDGLLKWGTLTGRRRVARKIGESPYLQNFLGDVAEAGKQQGSNVIFAGHSLGGVLLEKSATLMIEKTKPGKEQRLPHLFLLANSAELSFVSKEQMDRVNKSEIVNCQPENTRLLAPRILAVTSSKDLANMFLQPLNNYLLHPFATLSYVRHELFVNSMGFDRSTRSHDVQKTVEQQPQRPVSDCDLKALQFKLSLAPTLDPAFWVPNKDHRLTKYRIVPRPDGVRTPGFWNIKSPGSISLNHNDVYDDKFLAAGVSWFRMLNHNYADLPDTLPEMLAGLKKELRTHPPGSPGYKEDRRLHRTQWTMGAALRMPYNKTTFGLLLGELENSDAEIIDELDTARTGPADYAAIVRSHRVHLFAILKYTYSAHAVWDSSPDLLARLRALMEKEPLRDALARAGAAESGKDFESDKNLNSFYKFLRKHAIRTP